MNNYRQTAFDGQWLANKKNEASSILAGNVPGYDERGAIRAAERIVRDILVAGFPEYHVSSIRMRIQEVKNNLERPRILDEPAWSRMIIAGGD